MAAGLAVALSMQDARGAPVSLEAYAGRVVVLDVWAPWCAPCRASFPFLNDLNARYASQGLAVIGLTLEEAAHIQVPYVQPVSKAEVVRDVAFVLVSPFALTGSALTSISNLRGNSDGHRRWVNAVGIASGLTTIMVGARLATSDMSSDITPIGGALAAIGTTSVALSVRGIHRHRDIVEAQREASRRAIAQATVAPIVTTGSHPSAGVGVSLKF